MANVCVFRTITDEKRKMKHSVSLATLFKDAYVYPGDSWNVLNTILIIAPESILSCKTSSLKKSFT